MKIGKLRTDAKGILNGKYHWYLIPDDKVKRFDKIIRTMEHEKLNDEEYSDWEDELINCYERFRLPGGPWKLDIIVQS